VQMRWVLAGVAAVVLGACAVAVWIHLRQNSVPQVALALGRVRLVQERYPEAVTQFEKVLSIDPKNDGAYRGLAQAYAAMGLPDKAIESWQQDIALHPDSVDAYTQLAKFDLNRGDYDAAAGDFRRALNVAPANPVLLSGLGATLAHAGSYDESRNALEQSLRLAPSYSAWDSLGDLDLRQKRFADASADYEKALEFSNTDYHTWWYLAVAYSRAPGQKDKARSTFAQAARMCRETLKNDPNDPVLLSDLAAILSSQPDGHQESLKLLGRALALEPADTRVQFNAARTYIEMGDWRDAQAEIAKLVAAGFPIPDLDLSPSLAGVARPAHGPVHTAPSPAKR
jgi:tetratricopeptide (TPR) repeat protein